MKLWIEIANQTSFIHTTEPSPDNDGKMWESDGNELVVDSNFYKFLVKQGYRPGTVIELDVNCVWKRE
jgi:hypothetical protein